MPSKREIVEQMKREELQAIAEEYDLEVEDRRVRDHLIESVVRAKRVKLPDVLIDFTRERLKELCRALQLDDGGRDKLPIVERLCGEEEILAPARVAGSSALSGSASLLALLKREELLGIVDAYRIAVDDRRVREQLVFAVSKSANIDFCAMLSDYSRERLKELCQELGIDDGGREKNLIAARICDALEIGERGERKVSDEETRSLLERLLGPNFVPSGPARTWPAEGHLPFLGRRLPARIYARVIGGSSRGNPLERRFQNPSQGSPISDEPSHFAFLFGLWMEQGDERAVIVAFDAYRRAGRSTRFSVFMPLSLLERAADTGFDTHENSHGETIYAFRPENLGRYLERLDDEGVFGTSDRRKNSGQQSPPLDAPPPVAKEFRSELDSIYIRPRVGMYAAFARLNYKPWFALAEFVDNAVQSYLDHWDLLKSYGPLIIDVELDDNEISITDRAGGIAWKDFPRAFSPAAPPDEPTGLSEFGLGMKAAACWFARRWTVRTSALGEPVERRVSFDVPRIARETLENIPIETSPARASDHFTEVRLQDLRVRPRGNTISKIKKHLASIYRVLIEQKVVRIRITTGGRMEELEHSQPELLTAPYFRTPSAPPLLWRKDFSAEFDDRRVVGWAGIMSTGSHALAGFSVFRRRRLIEGSVGETYKPHAIFGSPNSFASLRVVGEMFVEGFDVTHTKDGIQWGGYEDEIIERISRQLDAPPVSLLDQADGYRSRKTVESLPPSFGAGALEATATELNQESTVAAIRASAEAAPGDETIKPETASLPEFVLREQVFHLEVVRDARPWRVELRLVRDSAAPFYSTHISNDSDSLVVQVNLAHEFSVAHINDNEAALHPVLRLLAAWAIGERMARDQGVSSPLIKGRSSDRSRGSRA